MTDSRRTGDPQMSATTLYLEEVFTDRTVGTIQRLTPVNPDGTPDATRPVVYIGQTQILTAAGALPLTVEIPATTLKDAADKFGEVAKVALNEMMDRLEEMRRDAASSIIVPEAGAGAQLGGMGGLPGGGKIRMP